MRIDIKDLPMGLQKQALSKLADEDRRRTEKKRQTALADSEDEAASPSRKRKSKYNAKKVERQLPDGTWHKFDSIHEARVYVDLSLMEQAGEISNLRIQVEYLLIPKQKAPSGKTYRECKYIADFVYEDSSGNTVVADAKGMKTDVYRLKQKLMLEKWGIEIEEV